MTRGIGDDMVIYFHRQCGWVDQAQPIYVGVPQCSNCGGYGISFVTYKFGVEEDAALALVNREIGKS